MNKYIKAAELTQWDAVAVTLEIEDDSSSTYYTMRQDLKPDMNLIANADSDNSGWSRWGSLIVEEILPDGIMTSLGEIAPGRTLSKFYSNVYPYRDGNLTAKLLNMSLQVTVTDPEDDKEYEALVPRRLYFNALNVLEQMIELAKEYFPQAQGFQKHLDSLRPTPENRPIQWDITVCEDNACILTAKYGLYPEKMVVPDIVKKDGKELKVLTVDGGGSARSGDLQRLVISNGIECIASFVDCKKLIDVSLPETLKEFAYQSFKGCSSLQHIEIPESVTLIGYEAFSNTALSKVILPKNLEKLYVRAFAGTPLTSIVIPECIDKIWDGCFEGCGCLTEVQLPEDLMVISCEAFKGCVKLQKINIPDEARYIGVEAFAGCSSLQEISVPEHILIDTDAFKDSPCKIIYRKTAQIDSWKKVEVVQSTMITGTRTSDYTFKKSRKEIESNPSRNKICESGFGFHAVYIKAFNQKFVMVEFNGKNYVLGADESVITSPNNDTKEIIKVF